MTLTNSNTPLDATTSGRHRLLADCGWHFTLGDPKDAQDPSFDDSGWRLVDLPHDWSIEGPYSEDAPTTGRGGYLPTGIGWYRRVFDAPAAWHGKRVHIEFDGVYRNSTVWINGVLLGHRPFGYITFEYDLTQHLRFFPWPGACNRAPYRRCGHGVDRRDVPSPRFGNRHDRCDGLMCPKIESEFAPK